MAVYSSRFLFSSPAALHRAEERLLKDEDKWLGAAVSQPGGGGWWMVSLNQPVARDAWLS